MKRGRPSLNNYRTQRNQRFYQLQKKAMQQKMEYETKCNRFDTLRANIVSFIIDKEEKGEKVYFKIILIDDILT